MPILPDMGWIKKNRNMSSQQDMRYEMRHIDERNLDGIMKLQDIVSQRLKDREIFRTHSADYFIAHLRMNSSSIGAFTDDGLIAYSILYFPGENEDNFGRDISLHADEMNRVAHLATVAVHPAYRGNSLQKSMYAVSLDAARKMGCKHVCCMVSPKNFVSLQNIFSHGFLIKALKMKFDRRLRYIMHRHLDYPGTVCSEEVMIKSTDVWGQKCLLKRGFFGYGAVAHPGGFSVSYGRDRRSASSII